MNKAGLLVYFLILLSINVFGQLSIPGIPESFQIKSKATKIIPVISLDSLPINQLLKTDIVEKINNRYSKVILSNINIKVDGVSTIITGKGTIWQYKILSPNAKAIGMYFNTFILPPEAKLFIYNTDHTQLLGAFTSANNNNENTLPIADLIGNTAIIEYFEPKEPQFEGQLIIGQISMAYREISYVADNTNVDRIGINCTQGNNWQNEKHAVCRMIFYEGKDGYYCTGFLVNNTKVDGTPYFMTANHCISTEAAASTLIAYFNFENSTCTSADASISQSVAGAYLKANNAYSDFSLLLLKENPPVNYFPYFAGWDATGAISSNSTCIHHPAGTPKCISLDYDATVNFGGKIEWDDGYISSPYTHWKVFFDEGATEGGSSGSPLFDSNKRVIGQLHGGGTTGEFYGKFNVSWNYSTTASQQLKYWLDPTSSGVLTLNGTFLNVKPKSEFSSSLQQICLNDEVTFTDKSAYIPKKWKWKVSPQSYEFTHGTDSLSQNPIVKFEQAGTYNISLVTENDFGADSILKTNYITTYENVNVSLSGFPVDSVICGCDLHSYKISGSGAVNYFYSIDRKDKLITSTSANSIFLTIRDEAVDKGNFNNWVKIIGITGTCSSTDSVLLKIMMPVNDYIKHAVQLYPGLNTGISNKCASVESYEPMPPLSDCNSNYSWCQGSSKLNGTLWFNFYAPTDGKINIKVTGYNNRIAVYDVDYYTQITSGRYNIIAANDNISATDSTSEINNLEVIKGRLYWLQVDADRPVVGDCSIELWSSSLEVYPSITSSYTNLILNTDQTGLATIKIYNIAGVVVKEFVTTINSESNKLNVDVSNLNAGVFYIQATINGTLLKSKLIKISNGTL